MDILDGLYNNPHSKLNSLSDNYIKNATTPET